MGESNMPRNLAALFHPIQVWVRTLTAIVLAVTSLSAMSERVREQDVTDTEIRIGNVMPYSGSLAVFGAIGKAETAYFEMINARGGINGRKVRFISYDDKSDPSAALDLTRGLIEQDKVLLMFGSFGTPGNFAVRTYLNERQIPQLFVASGDDHLSDPSLFPWTMGWQPSIREEGRIYANYIQAFYPGKRIVALWRNDHFGRELFKGVEDGLGDIARMIRVDIAYDIADARIDLKAIRGRDFCICRSAFRRSEGNSNGGGSQLASCVHIEPYGVIDWNDAEARRPGKRLGRNYSHLLEGCK